MESEEALELRGLARRIVEQLERLARRVRRDARSRLEVMSVGACRPLEPLSFCGVDSAFPRQPLDLVGVSASLVAAATVCQGLRGVERALRRRLLYSYLSEVPQELVVSTARAMERRLALLRLERGVDVLLLDGEIFPYKKLRPVKEGDPEALSCRLVDAALRAGVAVVGVVKRSYSRELSARLGYEVSDKALASLVLKRGEYVVVEPSHRLLSEHGCVIVYYKPQRGLAEAVKLEACLPKSLGLCKLLAWLSSETGATGLPWIIDLVDSYVKSAASSIELLRHLLLSELASRGGDIIVGYPSNPQEGRVS